MKDSSGRYARTRLDANTSRLETQHVAREYHLYRVTAVNLSQKYASPMRRLVNRSTNVSQERSGKLAHAARHRSPSLI